MAVDTQDIAPNDVAVSFDYSEYPTDFVARSEKRVKKINVAYRQADSVAECELYWQKQDIMQLKAKGYKIDWSDWVEKNVPFTVQWADKLVKRFHDRMAETEFQSNGPEVAPEAERPLTDLELMEKLSLTIKPYDVWTFSQCDDRFGHDYPGRIPGQLVANCLYFWTEQGDIVLDPMAGSGTTIDVCKALNRRVLAYDAHPCRDDITLHNLAEQGWPAQTSEAQLIFWDPPYFKKKDDGYGEQSISRLSRSDYLTFFERMAATIPHDFHGKLAFLMSDYTDDGQPDNSIWFTDYVNIFMAQGWRIERYIQVPLTTQSVHPAIVINFRERKRLARLGRVLAVMGR